MATSTREIFLSSTSEDLHAHRAKVREMIVRLRQVAIGMETWGAQPNKPLEACRGEVEQSDALIVVVGHRYGWIPGKPEGGDGKKSITWWEVQWALDAGKPVYAFLVDEAAAWTGKREQDRLAEATSDKMSIQVGRAVRSLKEFRAFLGQRTTREMFTSVNDLGAKVATSLHQWLYKGALAAAAAGNPPQSAGPPKKATAPPEGAEAQGAAGNVHWREQLHLLSAHRVVPEAQGVRVALIAGRADTGHPALRGAAIRLFEADLAPGAAADRGPDDYTTALAALIVGRDDASDYRGVAPGAELTIYPVLEHGSTTQAHMVAAVEAAVLEGAHVICSTLGGEAPMDAMKPVFAKASQLGAVVVCAAGNNGNEGPFYPAAYPGCIAAGAVDSRDRLADFSNFGGWVAVAAPAVNIPVAVTGHGYSTMSGTSFACGATAGAVALMLGANPKLAPASVAETLKSTGRRVGSDPTQPAAGLTSLDAHGAVLMAGRAEGAPSSP